MFLFMVTMLTGMCGSCRLRSVCMCFSLRQLCLPVCVGHACRLRNMCVCVCVSLYGDHAYVRVMLTEKCVLLFTATMLMCGHVD